MWIAPEEVQKRPAARPNPFQMPLGGGYRATSPVREPRPVEGSKSSLTPLKPETSPAKLDREGVPPRLPEGSLKPPRGPPGRLSS